MNSIVGDIIFYVLDIAILYMLWTMRQNSARVIVGTQIGPRWILPAVFWAIALAGFFNYTGVFRFIQSAALIAMGVIYWKMESGLSKDGVVMIGRLYRYEKIQPITVDEKNHCINCMMRGAKTPVFFPQEKMKDVKRCLAKYNRPERFANRKAKKKTK